MLDMDASNAREGRAFKDRVDASSEIRGVLRLDQLIGQQRPEGAGELAPVNVKAGVASPQSLHGLVEIELSSQAGAQYGGSMEVAGPGAVLTESHNVTSRANATGALVG